MRPIILVLISRSKYLISGDLCVIIKNMIDTCCCCALGCFTSYLCKKLTSSYGLSCGVVVKLIQIIILHCYHGNGWLPSISFCLFDHVLVFSGFSISL